MHRAPKTVPRKDAVGTVPGAFLKDALRQVRHKNRPCLTLGLRRGNKGAKEPHLLSGIISN
jgi:hypothetical protein